jgi:hypothetical protein
MRNKAEIHKIVTAHTVLVQREMESGRSLLASI